MGLFDRLNINSPMLGQVDPNHAAAAKRRFMGALGSSLLGINAIRDPGGAFAGGLASGMEQYDDYLMKMLELKRQQELDEMRREQFGMQVQEFEAGKVDRERRHRREDLAEFDAREAKGQQEALAGELAGVIGEELGRAMDAYGPGPEVGMLQGALRMAQAGMLKEAQSVYSDYLDSRQEIEDREDRQRATIGEVNTRLGSARSLQADEVRERVTAALAGLRALGIEVTPEITQQVAGMAPGMRADQIIGLLTDDFGPTITPTEQRQRIQQAIAALEAELKGGGVELFSDRAKEIEDQIAELRQALVDLAMERDPVNTPRGMPKGEFNVEAEDDEALQLLRLHRVNEEIKKGFMP